MIKLEAKRFELNFLLKLSDLKSNLTLTLSYLNPALNNPGLFYNLQIHFTYILYILTLIMVLLGLRAFSSSVELLLCVTLLK